MADFGGVSIDPRYLPTLDYQAPEKAKPSPVVSGVKAGLYDLGSYLASSVQGAGKLFGNQPIETFGRGLAQSAMQASQAAGRPDLEIAPWKEGGANIAPWLEYQVAKQVPLIGSYILAGKALPKGSIPASLERAGAQVPKVLGGGGLKAGADFATRRAALEAGKDFARTAAGAEVAGLPVAFASMVQEADQKPGGATTSDTIKAAALSPVYAALDALEPAQFKGLLSRGLEGNIIKRVATAGLVGAAAEVPQEGIQTAMEQSFRDDLSPQQKMRNIVDAAVTGGAIGGVFGGVGGIRRLKSVSARDISNEDLTETIDQAVLGLPAPSGAPAFTGQRIEVTPEGVAQPGSDYVQSELETQPQPAPETRPMQDRTTEELLMGARAAQGLLDKYGEKPLDERGQLVSNYLRLINAELTNRDVNSPVTNDVLDTTVAGAVERTGDVKSGVADQGFGAPASATFNINELTKGISTRKAYLGATNTDEARAILLKRLEAGSSAKGDILLAERLGVDLNEPAKVATTQSGVPSETGEATLDGLTAKDYQDHIDYVEAKIQAGTATSRDLKLQEDSKAKLAQLNTAPAAPANSEGGDQSVDLKFQNEWAKDLKGRQGLALKDFRDNPPVNVEQARQRLFEALGKNLPGEDEAKVDGYQTVVDLAKKYGVLDKEGQYTEATKELARKSVTMEEATQAALDQGYTGVEASAFDKGARGEKNVKLGSISELKAYNDGQLWSAPAPVATDTATEAKQAEKTGKRVTSATIPEAQRNMQFLNQAVDQVYGSTLKPQEQAQLKRMVREGATGPELDEAARYFASGRGALVQEQPERAPFKGEVITRGLVNAQRLVQQRNEAVRAQMEASLSRNPQDRRGAARRQSEQQLIQEHLRYKDQLRTAINEAAENGEITRKKQIGLIWQLVNNNFKGVEEGLSDPQLAPSRREFMAGVAASAAVAVGAGPVKATGLTRTPSTKLIDFAATGDVEGALQHIRNSSPNPSYRMIANKLLRGGMQGITLSLGGYSDVYDGRTILDNDAVSKVTVYDNGKGISEETLLHEMIHAYVGQRWAGLRRYLPENKKLLGDNVDRADALVVRFQDLWEKIAGALTLTNPEMVDREVWASEVTRNPDEMLSWVLTNPDAQAYLKTIDERGHKVETGKSLWQKLVDWVRGLLGLPASGKTVTALDQILSAGYSVLDAGAGVKTGDYSAKLTAKIQAQAREADFKLVPQINEKVSDSVGGAINLANGVLNTDGARGRVRRAALYFAGEGQVLEHWGSWFDTKTDGGQEVNGVQQRVEAMDRKHALASRLSQPVVELQDRINQLQRTDKASYQAINRLAQLTEHGLHPLRTWAQQSEAVRTSTNAPALKALLADAQPMVRSLTAKGTIKIYNDMRALNDVSILSERATRLHQAVILDKFAAGLSEFAVAPTDKFLDHAASAQMDLATAHDFWRTELGAQLAALDLHIDRQRQAANNPAAVDPKDMLARADALETAVNDTRKLLKQLNDAPYFHLGRDGEFFVAMRLRADKDGIVDPAALAAAAEHLQEFGKVISPESQRNRIYIRVDNEVAQKNLLKAAEKLQERGIVVRNAKDEKTGKNVPGILSGRRSEDKIRNSLSAQWLDHYVARIDGDDTLTDADKKRMIETARNAALDLMPDNSLALVMSRRREVPGFNPDMYDSFFTRQKIGIDAHVGLATSPKITQAFGHMRLALTKSQNAKLDEVGINRRNGMTDIIGELSRRDLERANQPRTPVLDMVRQASNTWALGLSPAFVMVQMAQPWQITLPKLGAKHGFIRSAKVMGAVSGTAFKVMRAVFSEGLKTSISRSFDAVIDIKSLQKAGVSRSVAEFLMHVANTGQLDIGGPTHELTRAVDGSQESPLSGVQRFASAPGYYAETFTRVLAALAYRELNSGGTEREAAAGAAQLLKDTMWNYAQDAQGRAFGKSGVLGKYTPLALQFMTYTSQLVQRLYLEIYKAAKGSDTEKKEALKFLMGHAAMTTAFAGTLGLPFATAFAAAYDALKDLFDDDDEPSNVRADYRNWLADTFGKGVGEAIARGPSRAAGVDLSQRLGEQDIVPFSRFLADRRDFKDKLKDLEVRAWGAPASQISNFLQGLSLLSDGKVFEGMEQLLPNSMAALAKSYQMTSEGYVDARGNKLPLESGARDALVQLIGFNPAARADYNEARRDQAQRHDLISRRAAILRGQLADAVSNGDDAAARDLIGEIQQFDSANPTYAVLPRMKEAIRSRIRAQSMAGISGSPLNVNPKDIDAQRQTRYANVEFRPQ